MTFCLILFFLFCLPIHSFDSNTQLLSFDGLLPGTWFALRVHYRLVFDPASPPDRRRQTLLAQLNNNNANNNAGGGGGELVTKQVGAG